MRKSDDDGGGATRHGRTVASVAIAKPVEWNKAAKRALLEMPYEARLAISQTLKAVQYGERPDDVSPFEGHDGGNVMKIRENFDGDTYRLIYAAKFEKAIYVLHAFKKKSASGIATPRREIEVVWERFREAERAYEAKYGKDEDAGNEQRA